MAAAHLLGSTPSFAALCSKASFYSRPEALRAKNKMRRGNLGLCAHGTGRLQTYRCKCCGMFHLGNKR